MKKQLVIAPALCFVAVFIILIGVFALTTPGNAACSASKTSTTTDATNGLFPETNSKISSEYLQPVGGIYLEADEDVLINKESKSDVAIAGNTVTVNETVGGDLFAAGNTVTVNGDVEDSVRIGARTATINGTVYGNTLIFANTVYITANAYLQGGANIYAGTIFINGAVGESVDLRANQVVLNGIMKDTVSVQGKAVSVGSDAEFTKEVTVFSPFALDVDSSATGTSLIQYQKTDPATAEEVSSKYQKQFSRWLISFFSFAMIGVLLILIWPKWAQDVSKTMREKVGETWQRGLLFFFIVPTLALLFAVTIVGIPISFLLMFFYVLMMLLGRLFTGMALGYFLVNRDRAKDKQKQLLLRFVVGYFVLSIIMSLAWIGWLFCSLACIWGVGGVLVIAKQRRKKSRSKK